MGGYSTKPSYYSKEEFVRKSAFKPQGKPTKDGKVRKGKTMFLAGGYSEFRDIQGRKTDHKNLKLTGSLEAGINVVKNENAALYGTTSPLESAKFEGLEEQYGVFGLTIGEQQFLKDEITDQAVVIAKKQ